MPERDTITETFITNEYCVEFNLVGSSFDPARITDILGVQPTQSGSAGEPRATSKVGATHDQSFWSLERSSRDDINECKDHHLHCLIDIIEPHVAALREEGIEHIYFYYTLSSSIGLLNIKLNAETISRLSNLGADMYISCFDCFDPQHPYWKNGVDKNSTANK